MSGRIEESKTPYFKIVARYSNPNEQTIAGRLIITDFACHTQNNCKYYFISLASDQFPNTSQKY